MPTPLEPTPPPAQTWGMEVQRLSGPLGAEVWGLDLARALDAGALANLPPAAVWRYRRANSAPGVPRAA